MTYRHTLLSVPMPPLYGGFMDAKEAGRIMREYRNKKGLTQPQVVDLTNIPSPQYLSALENGRYDVRNSDHFRSLIQVYGLTPEQVQELDPLAVISYDVSPSLAASAAAKGYRVPHHDPEPIPDELLEAAELYGGAPEFAELREYRWQRYLADIPFRSRPTTAAEWLRVYLNRKDEVDPKEPDA